MATILDSIRGEYQRYRALAEAAIAQLDDAELATAAPNDGNSVAVIVRHLSGNLRSRFTDFLTSDGEKPWRQREEEFRGSSVSREALLADWNSGWDVLTATLGSLGDDQLSQTVTIRRQPLAVHEALHRSLTHVSYHVGQIVFMAKALRGRSWQYLSIPPGQSDAYNAAPRSERPQTHAAAVARSASGAAAASRRLISSGSTFEREIGYSRAVVQGDWVFVSGTTGFDYSTMTISDNIVAQTEQCLRNIASALEQAGASVRDVVRVTYVLPHGDEFPQCWPVLQTYFGEVRPAAMMIAAGLADPRMRIEIEVTAFRQRPSTTS